MNRGYFVDRRDVYDGTSDYLKGRWMSVVGTLFFVYVIKLLAALLIITPVILSIFAALKSNMGPENIPLAVLTASSTVGGVSFLILTLFNSILDASVLIGLHDAIRRNSTLSMYDVQEAVRCHWRDILVYSVIISVITSLLSKVPLIGFILSIIANYVFAFAFLDIKEYRSLNIVEQLKRFYEGTKGHKLNLFLINLHYVLKPLLAMMLIIPALIISSYIPLVGRLSILVIPIYSVYLSIKYIPYLIVCKAIYYELK